MMSRAAKVSFIVFIVISLFPLAGHPIEPVSEPDITDYTAYPVFMTQSTVPNIMVILDNSGSMNWKAYDSDFQGEPYAGMTTISIAQNLDDLEENDTIVDKAYDHADDLDLGGFDDTANNSMVGLRFQNVSIDQANTIKEAYIHFWAKRDGNIATNLTITGQDSDNAAAFSTSTDDNISDISIRPETSSVSWNISDPWSVDKRYVTPNLQTIIQEIVDRPGWSSGNSMVFKISGEGKRDVYPINASSTKAPRLFIYQEGIEPVVYYGYFNPNYFYKYSSTTGKFVHAYKKIGYDKHNIRWDVKDLSGTATTLSDSDINTKDLWDGNWLNWVSMKRIDILRKVLVGGNVYGSGTSSDNGRDGDGTQDIIGEDSSSFSKWFDSTIGAAISPFKGNYKYYIASGYIYVKDTSGNQVGKYKIKVEKNYAYEPEDFHYHKARTTDTAAGWNVAGILQKIGDKARWGNIWFEDGDSPSGGKVYSKIGESIINLVDKLEDENCNNWTPLAETFYVAMQYFKQQAPASGLGYLSDAVPTGDDDDPYKIAGNTVECMKSFVLLLTDGASTMDSKIPDIYKDYDEDGDKKECLETSNNNCDYDTYGTDFLDDIAYYARTVDLRSATVGKSNIPGDQNLYLYNVYAFGSDQNARNLLMDASKNGGYVEKDGTLGPTSTSEWDDNGDGVPDTYFEATDGYAIERQLMNAITDILKRAASGTAASVLATNSEGEGTMIQAYFRTSVTEGVDEAKWLGFMQSLWIDPWGNIREDTIQNGKLDLQNSGGGNNAVDVDRIISYVQQDNDTVVRRFTSHYRYNPDNKDNEECIVSDCNPKYETVPLESVQPLFEAGELLADRTPDSRKIFTYIDQDQDKIVDDSDPQMPFDVSGELIIFDSGTASEIGPYLGTSDFTDVTFKYLDSTNNNRTANLIDFIRGKDLSKMRNRTLNGVTWKLGDIVNSTPVSVSKPGEFFHFIYSDASYQEFYDAMRDRETMIYVGANDGMLHAFTSWKYNADNGTYENPNLVTGEKLGDEVWAFIPQSILPHLKWLADPSYTHTYHLDLRPKVFDAKIVKDGTHYNDTDSKKDWGTFLLGGLNMGGGHIWVKEDFGSGEETRHFYPSYFLMDITDPRNPRLIWERTYENLQASRSVPAIVRVKADENTDEKWFAVFGSGPTDFEGNSTQGAYIYVVDLETGLPPTTISNDWLFGPVDGLDNMAFLNSPSALDYGLNYNVDAVYFGSSYLDGTTKGNIHKVIIPCTSCSWDGAGFGSTQYLADPANWTLRKLFSGNRPITAPLGIAEDGSDNIWIYFGTGQYIGKNDKTDASQQYLYGLKDPFFDSSNNTYYHDFTAGSPNITDLDIFNSDSIDVYSGGYVDGLASGGDEFEELLEEARKKSGWRLSLEKLSATPEPPSERIISKPSILGGYVIVPAFTPDEDICGFGGNSTIYGVDYETGTGRPNQLFTVPNPTKKRVDNIEQEKIEIQLPYEIPGSTPPRLGVHSGRQKGVTAFSQQSTGEVEEIPLNIEDIKSRLTGWEEMISGH